MAPPRPALGLGVPQRRAKWAISWAAATGASTAAAQGAAPGYPAVAESAECVWPTCASSCPACDRTGPNATQCIVTLPFVAACPVSQKCWLGRCSCYDGFCYSGRVCAPRQCVQGAKPPSFVPDIWVGRWNSFSLPGPTPEQSSTNTWWAYWFAAWLVPAFLVMLGLAVAGGTLRLLTNGPDTWLCRRAPRVPIFLPMWAALSLIITGGGFLRRERFVTGTSMVAREQLVGLKANVEEVLHNVDVLKATTAKFRAAVHEIPTSCHQQSLTAPVISKLIGSVDHATNSTHYQAKRLYHAIQALPGRIQKMLVTQMLSDVLLVWFPMVPAVFETFAMALAIIIGFLAFYSSDPRIAERAVRGMKKYGSWFFCSLTVLATVLSAVYLHTATVASRFCGDADANVLGLARNYDFSKFVKEDWVEQATEDIRQAVLYYVGGLGYNPFENITVTIETNVLTLAEVQNYTRWVQDLATIACPAVALIETDSMRTEMYSAVARTKELIHASNIWPYYDKLVHEVYCSVLPRRIASLVVFSLIIGVVLLPVLALTLDIDLKRMVRYKSVHTPFEDAIEEDEESTGDEEEDYRDLPPPKSSGTYTHVSPTVPSGSFGRKGPAEGHSRTFIA